MTASVIVVMGVSGCGKTTVARKLAERLGWRFAEADEFHSPANVAKMRSGVPLTDEDRWPWLAAIARWIDQARAEGSPAVVTCSALKKAYRDVLVGSRDDVALVHLKGDYDLIAARMAKRPHHYMPVTLLKSQFEALEEPDAGEKPVVIAIDALPEKIVDEILERLSPSGSRIS